MKLSFTRLVSMGALLFLGCTSSGETGPNPDLGGDTNIALGQVGNVFSNIGGIKVAGQSVPADVRMTVTKNDNGVATLRIVADLSKEPKLEKINKRIPSSMKDASGKVDTEVKLRITSEGVQDYFNRDGTQHTLVKYSSTVGDTYKLAKSNGATITRTVVAKSDQDDYPYGFMFIKTMTIEQDSRAVGIKKLVIRANHKFGIVWFEIVQSDGESIGMSIVSKN